MGLSKEAVEAFTKDFILNNPLPPHCKNLTTYCDEGKTRICMFCFCGLDLKASK